jgi:hypothetical protein
MKLLDFVILLLKTQAETLNALFQFLGRDILLEILERASDTEEPPLPALDFHPEWLSQALCSSQAESGAQAYRQIQQAVEKLRLAPFLEFYLWSYPFYRLIIESPLDLNADFKGTHSQEAHRTLVDKAKFASDLWINRLNLPQEVASTLQNEINAMWTSFQKIALNTK